CRVDGVCGGHRVLASVGEMSELTETQLLELMYRPLRSHTGLTIEHKVIVACQLTGTLPQISQWDAHRTGNPAKLHLVRFPHINEHRCCGTLTHLCQLIGRQCFDGLFG